MKGLETIDEKKLRANVAAGCMNAETGLVHVPNGSLTKHFPRSRRATSRK